MDKPNAVIFDMDGTLANVSGIRHYVRARPKNFDKFHAESINCPPNEEVAQSARDLANDHVILVVTARKVKWVYHTLFWLAENGIPYDELLMRDDWDDRPDYEVKRDILEHIRSRWTPVLAFDDNPNVIKLWEEHGIPTVHVEGWEYDN